MRNLSVQFVKLIAAILVVAIHTHPLKAITPFADYLLCNSIARLAVPFFFAISGYYFSLNLSRKGKEYIFSYFKKTAKVFCFWSVFYFTCFQFNSYLLYEKSIFHKILLLTRDFVLGMWGTQLWFIPALLVGLIFCGFLQHKNWINKYSIKIFMLLLFFLGCLFSNYDFLIKLPSPLLSLQKLMGYIGGHGGRNFLFMGVPLVYIGFLVARSKIYKYSKMQLFLSFLFYLAVSTLAYTVDGYYNPEVFFLCGPVIFFLIQVLLSDPLKNLILKRGRFLTKYDLSMGIYFIHIFYIRIIKLVSPEIKTFLLFMITTIISTLSIYYVKKCNVKFLKEFL